MEHRNFSVNQGVKVCKFKFEKNKIEVALQQRSSKTPYNNFFSIKTLSDPNAEFADINQDEYNKGIDGWLNLYKKTGKCVIFRRKLIFTSSI